MLHWAFNPEEISMRHVRLLRYIWITLRQLKTILLKKLRKMKKEPYVNVEWLDPETGELSTGTMYIDGFKVSLEHDTSGGSLWMVSFSLEDLNDV